MEDQAQSRIEEIKKLMTEGQDDSDQEKSTPASPQILQRPASIPADKQKPLPEGEAFSPGTKSIIGRGANMLNMGATGAEVGGGLGSLFGGVGAVPGAIAGGAAGAGLGAFMKPSETPGTDVGASLGDFMAGRAADALIPGTSALPKMGRALMRASGMGLGSIAGAIGDKKADFQPDTPYGKIGIYTGINMATALAAAAMPGTATKLGEMADKFDIPTNVTEQTGAFGAFTGLFGKGSKAATGLAKEQNAAGLAALEKLTGAKISDRSKTIKDAAVNTWDTLQQANDSIVADAANTTKYNSGLKAKYGPQQAKKLALTPDTFMSQYNLTPEENVQVRKLISADPENVIEHFLGPGGGNRKGEDQLGAVMKIMQKDDPNGADSLAKGLTMRIIGDSVKDDPNYGAVISGVDLAKGITKFGFDRLVTAFGGDKTRASDLMDLAQVMAQIDPSQKLAESGSGWLRRTMSYLGNKQTFAFASGAAVGSPGAVASAVGNAAKGAAGGLVAIVPLMAVGNYISQHPGSGRMLVAAANGDQSMANRLLRELMGAGYDAAQGGSQSQDESYGAVNTPTKPQIDMSGMFGRGR